MYERQKKKKHLLKGERRKTFDIYVFTQKTLWAHMNRLKGFREPFCFLQDIRLQSSKFACGHKILRTVYQIHFLLL